jgi:beta-phosphoglucomutase
MNQQPDAMGIRGFIFDLDGVLTDTAEHHYRAWQRLADEEGLPFSRADNEALRGVARRESLLRILKGQVVPEARLLDMLTRKNQYYLGYINEISPQDWLPGARELLEELHAAGYKTALGSASKNAPQVVAALGASGLLDAISDGNSVQRPKPAPDLFLHAAAQLGLAPAECVVVEDAAAGIEAARAGGFRSVGLGPRERVGQADAVFASLERLRVADILAALAEQR